MTFLSRRNQILLFCLLCSACGSGVPALAADLELHPTLGLMEEFNDNVNDTTAERKSDFITRVQPGGFLTCRGPRLTADASYTFDYRKYVRGTRSDEAVHNVAVQANAALVENFFFIDVSDRLSRVSLEVARDVSAESLHLNQTDQNVASVSPYLSWRLGEKTVLRTAYRYTDTRYWSPEGIDRKEHRGSADVEYKALQRLTLNGGYSYSQVHTSVMSYNEHDVSLGGRYEFAENSFIYGGIGNSWQDFSIGYEASNIFWNAGITKDMGFLVATAEARVQYAEDPLTVSTKETSYRVVLEKGFPTAAVGVSASYAKFDTLAESPSVASDNRSTITLGAHGRYDFSSRLSGQVVVETDKVSRAVLETYPYHVNGSAGATYSFNEGFTAALTYSYIDYRREAGSSAGGRQTNRVVAEVRKVF